MVSQLPRLHGGLRAAVIPALLLVGCANDGAGSTPAPTTTAARAGDKAACGVQVGPEQERRADAPPAFVDCTEPHGTEVWRKVDLPAPWNDPGRPRPRPGSPEEAELRRIALDNCTEARWRSYLNLPAPVPTPTGEGSGPTSVRNRWYYPTAGDWAAGARWIRCDLGFAWDQATRQAVGFKGLIVPAILSSRDRWMIVTDCVAGADAPSEAHVLCEQPHEAEVVSYYRISSGQRPSATDLEGENWRPLCAEEATAHLGLEAPADGTGRLRFETKARAASVADWDAGDHRVSCLLAYRDRTSNAVVRTTGTSMGQGTAEPRTS
jgi:hypothetical protein